MRDRRRVSPVAYPPDHHKRKTHTKIPAKTCRNMSSLNNMTHSRCLHVIAVVICTCAVYLTLAPQAESVVTGDRSGVKLHPFLLSEVKLHDTTFQVGRSLQRWIDAPDVYMHIYHRRSTNAPGLRQIPDTFHTHLHVLPVDLLISCHGKLSVENPTPEQLCSFTPRVEKFTSTTC